MKHNVLLATIVAVMTAAGTVATFYPATVIAEDTPTGPPPEIAQPVLEVNGCTLTLALATGDLKAGDPINVVLTASNPTDEPVEAEVLATVSAMPVFGNVMVRSMPMPVQTWQQSCRITLSAGETKGIAYDTTYQAEAGTTLTLSLQAGEQVVAFGGAAVPPAIIEEAPADGPAEPVAPTEEPTDGAPLESTTVRL